MARERDATTGVLSLTPLLNPGARSLSITLRPALLPSWDERRRCLEVDLQRHGP